MNCEHTTLQVLRVSECAQLWTITSQHMDKVCSQISYQFWTLGKDSSHILWEYRIKVTIILVLYIMYKSIILSTPRRQKELALLLLGYCCWRCKASKLYSTSLSYLNPQSPILHKNLKKRFWHEEKQWSYRPHLCQILTPRWMTRLANFCYI